MRWLGFDRDKLDGGSIFGTEKSKENMGGGVDPMHAEVVAVVKSSTYHSTYQKARSLAYDRAEGTSKEIYLGNIIKASCEPKDFTFKGKGILPRKSKL